MTPRPPHSSAKSLLLVAWASRAARQRFAVRFPRARLIKRSHEMTMSWFWCRPNPSPRTQSGLSCSGHSRAGGLRHDEIGKALSERCDWFLVGLSPSAVNSKWVKHELVYALNNAPFQNGRITPLLARTCDWRKLSFTLGNFQFVDFRKSFDAGCRELLRGWGIEYRAP